MSGVCKRNLSTVEISTYTRANAHRFEGLWDCLLIALPFSLAAWMFSGIEAWPQNDDPFYGRPVQFFAEEGRVQLVKQYGQLTASSVGHIAPAALWCSWFGFSYQQLFAVCIFQQLIGAMAIYWCSRWLGAGRAWAVLLTAVLVVCPLYFGHAFTFMTDGPATAWVAIACGFMAIGLVQEKLLFLVLASAATAWGVWIRQTNVFVLTVPLFSILLFGNSSLRLWLNQRTAKRTMIQPASNQPAVGLIASLGIAVGSIALLESGCVVHSSSSRLEDIAPDQLGASRLKSIAIGGYGFCLIVGWLCLPILPAMISKMRSAGRQLTPFGKRLCWISVWSVMSLLLFPFAVTLGRASITSATGTFIQNGHFGPIFMSDMDEPGRWGELAGVSWPVAFWMLLTLLSIVSFSCLVFWGSWTVAHWYRQFRNKETVDPRLSVGCALLGMVVGSFAVVLMFVEPLMDRYWMFLFPPILVWLALIATLQQWTLDLKCWGWAGSCLAGFFAMSIVFTHDLLAWNNARWSYVTAQLSAGVQPRQIDGGRDVNAWLRMREDPETNARLGDSSNWWSGFAEQCVAVGPRQGWVEVHQLPWHSWATLQTQHLHVLKRESLENKTNNPSDELVQK